MACSFRVHYEHHGQRHSRIVFADKPALAAILLRKLIPGAVVHKIKVVRE